MQQAFGFGITGAGVRGMLTGLVCGLALAGVGAAQTLATGDARTVTEPAFPVTCGAPVAAQQGLSGGQPVSETVLDTTRIQAALTACTSGQAVELVASGTNVAFISGPLNFPNGVSLIVDGGVTLFASRNPADFQTGTSEVCGSYGSSGNSCLRMFTFNNNSTSSGSGIYGYGVIDGRGGSTLLKNGVDSGISWWTNADQANTAGKSQDNVVLMKPSKANNFTLYKITLRNSPMFHVGWQGTGFTAWGVKIQAPFTAHNTDGIDPVGSNITITNSSISDGDDEIAVGASSASSNVTISNVTTYSGHGISVGSYTQGGLTNMLVKNVNMAGSPTDGNENGLRLKSSADRGGLLNTITYQNVCMRDMKRPLLITPFYNTNAGTSIPTFQNVVLQNVHVLAPTLNSLGYIVSVEGADASHTTSMTMNNVVFDTISSYLPAFSNVSIALAGNVYPAALQSQPGTVYTGAATSTPTPAFDCSATATVFPYILGEMYLSTATATNLQSATGAANAAYTLHAMVQPAQSQTTFNGTVGSYTGAPALTGTVNFYEGTTLVGSGTLGANGTLASMTLPVLTGGTHTYTAQYTGDANYNTITFGSVTVTASSGTASTTTLTAPTSQTYGASTPLSATVAGAGGTPSGTVAFFDGTTKLVSGTLASGTFATTTTLAGGVHTLTAVYAGDTTFAGSTSAATTLTVGPAATTTAVTVNPTSVAGGSTTTVTATVTGVSGSAKPSGTVTFTDGSNSLGSANLSNGVATLVATLTTPGARTMTATYGADTNYNASSGTAALTVTAFPTTTVLTAPASVVYGSTATLTATVNSGYAGASAATVTFYEGTTVLGTITPSSGVATLLLPVAKLGGGPHSYAAVFAGDANQLTSTGTGALTVATATTTTAESASPVAVSVGGTTVLTATVTGVSGAATASGTVTFADGATLLGSATLNNGVAMLSATLPNIGTRTITANYGGDINYAASAGTASVTVSAATTTLTLTVSKSTSYPNVALTLTATVAPAAAPGTVTFSVNGTAAGTASLSGGVATLVYTPTAVGSLMITAALPASANYVAAASSAVTVSVVAPVTGSSTPSALTITAGTSGTVALSFASTSGYAGTFTLACTSPVSYMTCSVSTPTLTVSGASAVAATGTITVAATTGALATHSNVVYAWLLPLGLLGLVGRRRRKLSQRTLLLMLLAAVATLGFSGCGGTTAGAGSGGTRPSGMQTINFTATASGTTQTTAVVVTIN